jgi:hypothetical protein
LAVVALAARARYRSVSVLPAHDPDLARGLEYESP